MCCCAANWFVARKQYKKRSFENRETCNAVQLDSSHNKRVNDWISVTKQHETCEIFRLVISQWSKSFSSGQMCHFRCVTLFSLFSRVWMSLIGRSGRSYCLKKQSVWKASGLNTTDCGENDLFESPMMTKYLIIGHRAPAVELMVFFQRSRNFNSLHLSVDASFGRWMLLLSSYLLKNID